MKKIFLVLILITLLVPVFIIANEGGPGVILKDPGDIERLFDWALGFIWGLMIVAVTVMLLFAGFTFITAGGEEQKITKAKDMLKYSLIGVAVIVLSGSILWLIRNILLEGAAGS